MGNIGDNVAEIFYYYFLIDFSLLFFIFIFI